MPQSINKTRKRKRNNLGNIIRKNKNNSISCKKIKTKNTRENKRKTTKYGYKKKNGKMIQGTYKRLLNKNENGPFEIIGPHRNNLNNTQLLLFKPINKKIFSPGPSYEQEKLNRKQEMNQEIELQRKLEKYNIVPKINSNFAIVNKYYPNKNNNKTIEKNYNIKNLQAIFVEKMYPLTTLKESKYTFTTIEKIYNSFILKIRKVIDLGYIPIDMKEDNLLLNYDHNNELTNVYLIDTDPSFFKKIPLDLDEYTKNSIVLACLIFLMFWMFPNNILSLTNENDPKIKENKIIYFKKICSDMGIFDFVELNERLLHVHSLTMEDKGYTLLYMYLHYFIKPSSRKVELLKKQEKKITNEKHKTATYMYFFVNEIIKSKIDSLQTRPRTRARTRTRK
tara:strand:+ start:593 stop:1771 length:1179 start_codon:yes stop_codon:yes gene_type:complete